ncbi:MAG TPA: hypothetical protein VG713_00765, partial [Pirellulales bacterium]|nr:hypothetical protein [Pirellulales bacterium]
YSPEIMQRAVIMHYHAALCPDYWPTMLAQLRADRPVAYGWLEEWGPITGRTHFAARVVRKALKELRHRRCRRFIERCHEVHAEVEHVC